MDGDAEVRWYQFDGLVGLRSEVVTRETTDFLTMKGSKRFASGSIVRKISSEYGNWFRTESGAIEHRRRNLTGQYERRKKDLADFEAKYPPPKGGQ